MNMYNITRPNRIFLDLDDVLVDLRTQTLRALGPDAARIPKNMWNTDELYDIFGINEQGFWDIIDGGKPDFWYSLPMLPWAKMLYLTCQQVAPTIILTKPTPGPQCAAGKSWWLHTVLGTRDFLLGPPKWSCAAPGALLIDDSETNCGDFTVPPTGVPGGNALLFPRPWNSGKGSPEDVIKALMELA